MKRFRNRSSRSVGTRRGDPVDWHDEMDGATFGVRQSSVALARRGESARGLPHSKVTRHRWAWTLGSREEGFLAERKKDRFSCGFGPSLCDFEAGLSDLLTGLSDSRCGLSDLLTGLSDSRAGLTESRGGLTDLRRGLTDFRESLIDSRGGLTDFLTGLSESPGGLSDFSAGLTDSWCGLTDSRRGSSDCLPASRGSQAGSSDALPVLLDGPAGWTGLWSRWTNWRAGASGCGDGPCESPGCRCSSPLNRGNARPSPFSRSNDSAICWPHA
jgi:hypothetical protein